MHTTRLTSPTKIRQHANISNCRGNPHPVSSGMLKGTFRYFYALTSFTRSLKLKPLNDRRSLISVSNFLFNVEKHRIKKVHEERGMCDEKCSSVAWCYFVALWWQAAVLLLKFQPPPIADGTNKYYRTIMNTSTSTRFSVLWPALSFMTGYKSQV